VCEGEKSLDESQNDVLMLGVGIFVMLGFLFLFLWFAHIPTVFPFPG